MKINRYSIGIYVITCWIAICKDHLLNSYIIKSTALSSSFIKYLINYSMKYAETIDLWKNKTNNFYNNIELIIILVDIKKIFHWILFTKRDAISS